MSDSAPFDFDLDCWACHYGTPVPMSDARPLNLIQRFRILPRNHARPRPRPCRCELMPHAFCYVVTCRCDHGIGA